LKQEADMNFRCQKSLTALGLSLGLAAAAPAARADDHIQYEISRSYAGRTFRPQTLEVWIAPDRTYIRDGVVINIVRPDLKVRWTILPSAKKYLEEPLDAPDPATTPQPVPSFRIQDYGFDYEPKYDWSVTSGPAEEIIEGKSCRKITLIGDDDCMEETREFWFSTDLPIDIGRYFDRLVKPDLDPGFRFLYDKHPDLKTALVVKSVTVEGAPIGLPATWTRKLVKAEAAPAPAGIYDLPADLVKVKTQGELFAR
jgi:hypothetical protein